MFLKGIGANNLDNGCSRHMFGNRSWFTKLRPKDGGVVKFADGTSQRPLV